MGSFGERNVPTGKFRGKWLKGMGGAMDLVASYRENMIVA